MVGGAREVERIEKGNVRTDDMIGADAGCILYCIWLIADWRVVKSDVYANQRIIPFFAGYLLDNSFLLPDSDHLGLVANRA